MKTLRLLLGILLLPQSSVFAAERTAASLVTQGLVGHWKLDGDLRDTSPDSRHAALTGITSHPDTSLGGRVMVFNGANTRMTVPADRAPTFDTGDLSIALWVRPQKSGDQIVAAQSDDKGGWQLRTTKDWRAELVITGPNGKSHSLRSPANTLVANRWAHVAVSAQRGRSKSARVYINGLLMTTGQLPATPLPAQTALTIGGHEKHFFRGQLDEIYLFSRALTAKEVKTLWYPGFRFFYEPLAKNKFDKAQLKPGRVAGTENPVEPLDLFADRRFTVSPDDTIAIVGGGNFEATQKHGHLESLLIAAHPDAGLRFRNVAWEGDTVYEQWRDVNYGSWAEQLGYLNADVLLIQFGQMEALDGPDRLHEFDAAYQKLINEFKRQTRRIVLVSPIPFEKPPAIAAPDLSQRNFPDLAAYVIAIEKLAIRNGLPFIDLFTPLVKAKEQLTRDGIHLAPTGHRRVAETAARQLGVDITSLSDLEKLRAAVDEKNRLWAQYWRPMNYAFAFGDRTHVAFGKGEPSLREEIDELNPLLQTAEAAIDAVANGATKVPRIKPLAERPHSQITVLSAEEQIASFTVRDDLQVNLFASETDGIINPVQMRWDERGRLWVLCLPTYPHVTPGDQPNDFVLVCEDTNRDGRADKFHRFAEGLYLPMGLELGHDGLYVGHGDELIHLQDTDGDGRADQRRVVFSGFGTGDSHQLINSMIWSPNGRLWFTQGHHVYSRVETPYGIEKHLKAGVWRLHPHRLRLDSFFHQSTAGANCWGVVFDDWGQVFHNTGAQYAAYYTVPGMLRTDHPLRTRELFTGSKNTCIEILGSRHLPDDLQGVVAFAGFYNNSLPAFRVSDDASGFKTERLPDLVTSTRREFRPVDIRTGPDGAVYLCDWYNEIVGHYQASYRDPRRDKKHGRIWRVSARNRPPFQPPNLADMNADQLVAQLRSPERWVRYQAKRLLFHRDKRQVLAACDRFAKQLGPDEFQLLYRLIGIYEAHEELREDLLHRLLESHDHRARCYGVRMIGTWAHRLGDALELARRFVNDPHPRVRLEAVVAATYIADPRAIEIVTEALSHPTDDFLDYALTQAVHALKPQWKPALAAGRLNFGGHPERMAFVLRNDESGESLAQVRSLLGSSQLDETGRIGLLKLMADVGTPQDLRQVFDQSRNRPDVLHQLADVSRVRKHKPAGDVTKPLTAMIRTGSDAVRIAALRLAGAWQTKALLPTARKLVEARQPPAIQAAAIETIGALQGRDALSYLQKQASPGRPFPIQLAAIRALIPLHSGIAAKKATVLANHINDQARMTELLTPLLNHSKAPDLLAKHFGTDKPRLDAAKLILRVMNAAGHNAPALRHVLNTVLGTQGAIPEYSPAYVKQLAAEVKSKGDPQAGRAVFQSPLANCVACHKIDGQGGLQGPDLSSIGTGMTVEAIIESILWPRRQVKEGYLATSVTTKDDEFHQGYKLRESKTELVLRDAATGKELRLAKRDLADRRDAGTLMPDGLTLGMTRTELRNLTAYLATRGVRH